MAMEERDARIISHEADSNRAVGHDLDSVATHGRSGGDVDGEVGAAGGAGYDLEVVAVEMEGVGKGIVVLEGYFYDGAAGEDVRVRVCAVDGRVIDLS